MALRDFRLCPYADRGSYRLRLLPFVERQEAEKPCGRLSDLIQAHFPACNARLSNPKSVGKPLLRHAELFSEPLHFVFSHRMAILRHVTRGINRHLVTDGLLLGRPLSSAVSRFRYKRFCFLHVVYSQFIRLRPFLLPLALAEAVGVGPIHGRPPGRSESHRVPNECRAIPLRGSVDRRC